jgi:hypothetical protein
MALLYISARLFVSFIMMVEWFYAMLNDDDDICACFIHDS